MPFTNVWDDTFPADTELANLLGANLRQVRLDAQQRMAAISGLDASKPAFGADAQPANWNGILFFATDTGKIYQFNNPAWTDVTNSFRLTTTVVFRNNTQVVHTGDTTLDTIFTAALPVLGANSVLRCTLSWKVNAQGAVGTSISMNLGGTQIITHSYSSVGNYNGVEFLSLWYVINKNSVSSQKEVFTNQMNAAFGQIVSESVGLSAVNTGVAVNLLVQAQNGANTDSQNFDSFIVELL